MAKRKKIRKMKKENMYLSSFYLQLYLVSSSGRAPEETFREGSVQERLLVPDQHHTYHHHDHHCNALYHHHHHSWKFPNFLVQLSQSLKFLFWSNPGEDPFFVFTGISLILWKISDIFSISKFFCPKWV